MTANKRLIVGAYFLHFGRSSAIYSSDILAGLVSLKETLTYGCECRSHDFEALLVDSRVSGGVALRRVRGPVFRAGRRGSRRCYLGCWQRGQRNQASFSECDDSRRRSGRVRRFVKRLFDPLDCFLWATSTRGQRSRVPDACRKRRRQGSAARRPSGGADLGEWQDRRQDAHAAGARSRQISSGNARRTRRNGREYRGSAAARDARAAGETASALSGTCDRTGTATVKF